MAANKSVLARRRAQSPVVQTAESDRDRLARAALAASEVTLWDEDGRYFFTPDELAARCYAVADAMLRVKATRDAEERALLDYPDPMLIGPASRKAFAAATFAIVKTQVKSRRSVSPAPPRGERPAADPVV